MAIEANKSRIDENKFPDDILDMTAFKNNVRRDWQKHRLSQTHERLGELQNCVRNRIRERRFDSWDKKLSSLTTEDNSIWRMAIDLKKSPTDYHPIHGVNGIVYNDEDKVEAFGLPLEDRFQDNVYLSDEDTSQEVLTIFPSR